MCALFIPFLSLPILVSRVQDIINQQFKQDRIMNKLTILKRDSLKEGGFAGLREHQLVKSPRVFGSAANHDGSLPGLDNFVYLADARFMPHGETHMHDHHEVDVISIMVDGRLAHQGSLGHGQDLNVNDVQVQRAGGTGFSHNEVNPDEDWNRMIQIWVLPEQSGQAADYYVYSLQAGKTLQIYGGSADNDANNRFPGKTMIDVVLLEAGQGYAIDKPYNAYITRGRGMANGQEIMDGDFVRGENGRGFQFTASNDVQLIVIHY